MPAEMLTIMNTHKVINALVTARTVPDLVTSNRDVLNFAEISKGIRIVTRNTIV